jgi:hypothetical protein
VAVGREPGGGASAAPAGTTRGLGIASLVFGALAASVAAVPRVGLLALPLGCLGLTLGAVGVVLVMTRKSRGLVLPASGSALNGLALAFVAVSLGQPTLRGWLASVSDGPSSAPGGSPAPAAANGLASSTIDLPLEKLTFCEDTGVMVSNPMLTFVPLVTLGERGQSTEKKLLFNVILGNRSGTRVLGYHSWGSTRDPRQAPRLTDNLGNEYPRADFGVGTEVNLPHVISTLIPPGEKVVDTIVFDAPSANVEHLILELPASAFGTDGNKFRCPIPASAIKRD